MSSDHVRVCSPVNPGDIVGGRYRVERVLGAGGMGVVVAAKHTELDQPVALKFILPEAVSGKDAIERFMREARSVARLKSEHVARVFDVGRDETGSPYMVLELLEGLALAKLNKQKGPFPVADTVEYVLQACEALVEAHSAGIVHRDLKPQNIFVSRRLNGTPLVKVLDFGIAKAFGAAAVGQLALTDSQAVMGSPLYMAPEHMRSARAADIRSDIWSLGVILYELLGGQPPFDGETVTEVCIRVVNEPPESLLALRPGLDEKLVAVVMRALEKDPARRWQNVAQLATALEPYARSAQQGVVLRPWRSFEDTMDSRPPPRGADDTGPSTAVTMPTGEDIARALRGVSGPAPFGAVTPAQARSAPPSGDIVRPLVSTDVTWGRGAEPEPRRSPFRLGIAVGAMVSIAVAAVVIIGLRSSSVVKASASSPPPPSVAEATPAPSAAPAPSSAPAPSDPPPALSVVVAETVVSPSSLPAATVAPTVRARPPGRGRATTPATTNGSTAAPVAPPVPADTQAPNGAPILR